MGEQVPKAAKVEMMSTILKVEFQDGTIKYLKSHLNKEYSEAFSFKKDKKKNILLAPHTTWLGTEIQIKENGTVILNEKDEYSPEELWNNSKEHISQL